MRAGLRHVVLPHQRHVRAERGLANQCAGLCVQARGAALKPVIAFERIPTPRPPVLTATPPEYQLGANLHDAFCLRCHGVAAVTGGVLPDLRKSGRLQDAGLWKAAVVDAALASRGMPRFAGHVSPADAERIRAYVARQAAILYEEEGAQRAGAAAVRRASRP